MARPGCYTCEIKCQPYRNICEVQVCQNDRYDDVYKFEAEISWKVAAQVTKIYISNIKIIAVKCVEQIWTG